MQTRPEGPSGEAIAGRDSSCGFLGTAATLSNMILPVSAPHRTRPLPNLPVFHPSPLAERMHRPSRRISGHDVHTARCAAAKERGWGAPVSREHGWELSAACPAPAQHSTPSVFGANVRKLSPAQPWHW